MHAVAIFLTLAVAGCAAPPSGFNTVRSDVAVRDDPYLKATIVEGPAIGASAAMTRYRYTLRGAKTSDGATTTVLVISSLSRGWAFFSSARDIDGNELRIRPTSRDILASQVEESFAIELPQGYLPPRRVPGLNIRLDGPRGFHLVVVPGQYVQAFDDQWKTAIAH